MNTEQPTSALVKELRFAAPGIHLRGLLFAAADRLEALERAQNRIGPWLSAALDDPNVCAEMKADINAWFATPVSDEALREIAADIVRIQFGKINVLSAIYDKLRVVRSLTQNRAVALTEETLRTILDEEDAKTRIFPSGNTDGQRLVTLATAIAAMRAALGQAGRG